MFVWISLLVVPIHLWRLPKWFRHPNLKDTNKNMIFLPVLSQRFLHLFISLQVWRTSGEWDASILFKTEGKSMVSLPSAMPWRSWSFIPVRRNLFRDNDKIPLRKTSSYTAFFFRFALCNLFSKGSSLSSIACEFCCRTIL